MKNIHNRSNVSKKIAYGAIINLLTVVSLYLASILPTNRLFFFGLSSFFLSVIVIEFGVSFAFTTFMASSILGLIIIPNKMILVPYIMFFGYYGIVKFFIEKINNVYIEWIVKLMIFNISVVMVYLFTNRVLFSEIKIYGPTWAFIYLGELIFIIYDISYSFGISYYKKHFRMFRGFK